MTDDLPIIQSRPGPTDAELEAQRDARHEREVREWFEHQDWLDSLNRPHCDQCGIDHLPPQEVIG